VVQTKVIAVQVDDMTYERLLQLALAKGVSLSDYVKERLGLEQLMKATHDEVEKRTHELRMSTLKRDAEEERGSRYSIVLKEYTSVDKRIVIYWRTRPLTEYDALTRGLPDKAGMWELKLQKESKDAPTVPHANSSAPFPWYVIDEESKFYYKRRGLYHAINTLCRKYGRGPAYHEKPKLVPRPMPPSGGTSP
jgi:hypothetical protein